LVIQKNEKETELRKQLTAPAHQLTKQTEFMTYLGFLAVSAAGNGRRRRPNAHTFKSKSSEQHITKAITKNIYNNNNNK
jgi:hypothetical protein